MEHILEADKAIDVWRAAVVRLTGFAGLSVSDPPSREVELPHVMLSIKNPHDRWFYGRFVKVSPAFAVAEVVWSIMGGSTGDLVRRWPGGIDQKQMSFGSVPQMLVRPLSRNLILGQLLNTVDRLSFADSDARLIIPSAYEPSLTGVQHVGPKLDASVDSMSLLSLLNGKLDWLQVGIGGNLFTDFPYDVFQFTIVQEIMAGRMGVEVGKYMQLCGRLYCREDQLREFQDASNEDSLRSEPNFDSLSLPKDVSNYVLNKLKTFIEILCATQLSIADLQTIADGESMPAPYQNLALLLCAEAARLREWTDDAEGLIWGCTNPMLIQAWLNWRKYADGFAK